MELCENNVYKPTISWYAKDKVVTNIKYQPMSESNQN